MPSFFTRELREQVQALDSQLAMQESAHLESVEYMAQQVWQLQEENRRLELAKQHLIVAHSAQEVRLKALAETEQHLYEVELARREGQIGELIFKGKLLDLLAQQHHWVRDGQASSHGVMMDVWKCAGCMSDPQCNPRVLLPAGTRWRAVQDE